jgi:two-component system LytT family sensor kinase
MIKIFRTFLSEYRLHMLIWSLFIVYESVVIGLTYKQFGHPLTYVAHYTIIIFLFYLHANFILKFTVDSAKQKWWSSTLIVFLEVSLFVVASYVIDRCLIDIHVLKASEPLRLNSSYFLKTLYRCIYFMGFSTGYYFLNNYVREREKTSALEQHKLAATLERQEMLLEMRKTQNAFLLAQINPHFIFNTLHFIYHDILSTSPKAAEAITLLSDMMRFAIDADQLGDRIILGDEITQVENLIYLNQIRNNIDLTLEVDDNVMHLYLLPLILLTLVENIFKHGDLSLGNRASINIYNNGTHIVIETDNLPNTGYQNSYRHTGLTNISKRLSFAYSDDCSFTYGTNEYGRFQVSLKVPLENTILPPDEPVQGIDKHLTYEV